MRENRIYTVRSSTRSAAALEFWKRLT